MAVGVVAFPLLPLITRPNLWSSRLRRHRPTNHQVIEELKPGLNEMVLPKTSSSVFNSTNIDFILRSMNKRYLILAGCVTDQCVAHAVMDACDMGYMVTLVPEATATYSQQRQDAALEAIKGYCRMRSVEELALELLQPAVAAPS
ncbi:hypothetical protein Vretimale_11400 [Volvox reticuliferus]|uniref:Isochorismatase-like domain-containing protein n=1 Tax=Volvox reticuliferus TaxID=1737510 RepID=A0A8J4GHI1_9CHLO|nr:hypothetical protein Vretimale_11400 [Volvox reticuliferus]